MSHDMKTVVMPEEKRQTLHIETPLGVINIEVGLRDRLGRRVERVGINPNRYVGEPKVLLRGCRLVECKHAKGKP